MMTHYQRHDGSTTYGVCGARKDPRDPFVAEPTCPACWAWIAADRAASDDLTAWIQESEAERLERLAEERLAGYVPPHQRQRQKP